MVAVTVLPEAATVPETMSVSSSAVVARIALPCAPATSHGIDPAIRSPRCRLAGSRDGQGGEPIPRYLQADYRIPRRRVVVSHETVVGRRFLGIDVPGFSVSGRLRATSSQAMIPNISAQPAAATRTRSAARCASEVRHSTPLTDVALGVSFVRGRGSIRCSCGMLRPLVPDVIGIRSTLWTHVSVGGRGDHRVGVVPWLFTPGRRSYLPPDVKL